MKSKVKKRSQDKKKERRKNNERWKEKRDVRCILLRIARQGTREREERIAKRWNVKRSGVRIDGRRGHILRFCDGTRVVSARFNVKGGALNTFCNNANVWANWRILYAVLTSNRLTPAPPPQNLPIRF